MEVEWPMTVKALHWPSKGACALYSCLSGILRPYAPWRFSKPLVSLFISSYILLSACCLETPLKARNASRSSIELGNLSRIFHLDLQLRRGYWQVRCLIHCHCVMIWFSFPWARWSSNYFWTKKDDITQHHPEFVKMEGRYRRSNSCESCPPNRPFNHIDDDGYFPAKSLLAEILLEK